MDAARVLRPLDEAGAALDRLREYESPDELGAALGAVRDAVDRSLRLLLREDRAAPDELRLTALSPTDLPLERVIEALRRRELITLELAAAAHRLEQSASRPGGGAPLAADADAALEAAERLRREVSALADRPIREAAHAAVEARTLEEPARRVPLPGELAPGRRRRLIVAAAVGMLLLLALVLLLRRPSPLDQGVTAFRADRSALAETHFRAALEDEPENVLALLYLGRIYRRQERYEEAADALERAAGHAPTDADVRRELGYLFTDLGRFDAAIEQLDLAVEHGPEQSANWIGLVRALCLADHPRAEETVLRAPAEARAALGSDPCAAFGRPSPIEPQ